MTLINYLYVVIIKSIKIMKAVLDKKLPTSITARRLKRAAKTVRSDFAKLSSTDQAESMTREGDDSFQIKKIYPEKGLPMKIQMDQIRGKLKKESEYGSAEYFNLIKTVVPLRESFVKTKDDSAKKEIAGEEIRAWLSFVEARKEMLKDNSDFTIQTATYLRLKEAFDRERSRKTAKVPAKALVDMHGNFGKVFKVNIPIHPRNLSQIIHPHQGYMTYFGEDRCFEWDELD